ncbi:MAG: hypothetical protein ING51_15700 [Rhodocyclaceae bacterium]|nr:hypothetical protein [Rhodocyclaceae bacterium]
MNLVDDSNWPLLLIHPPMQAEEGLFAYRSRLMSMNKMSIRQLSSIGLDVSMLVESGAAARGAFPGSHLSQAEKELLELFGRKPGCFVDSIRRFCPRCVFGGSPGRPSHELLFAEACTKHHLFLRDECEQCGEVLFWEEVPESNCRCGAALHLQSERRAPEAVVFLALLLEARAVNSAIEAGPWSTLAVDEIQSLVLVLGTYLANTPSKRPQKISDINRLSVTWSITSLAAEVIYNWPNSFHAALVGMRDRAAGLPHQGSLQRIYSGLVKAIFSKHKAPEFSFLRNEFERYVEQSWTGALARRNRRLSVYTILGADWVPIKKCRKVVQVSRRQLLNAIGNGAILSSTRTTARGRKITVVSKRSAKQALQEIGKVENLEEFSARVGINKAHAARVVPILLQELNLARAPGQVWEIPTALADNLLTRLEGCSCVGEIAPELVAVSTVLKNHKLDDDSVAGLLAKLANENIRIVGISNRGKGIGKAVIRKNDLATLIEKQEQARLLTIPDVATSLGIKQEVAYHLVNQDLLKTFSGKSHPGGRLVARSAIREFGERYVFARDISRSQKTSSRKLALTLSQQGVEPVCAPWVDGCRQIVFARAAVASHL